MIRKLYTDKNVLELAKVRIKNIFNSYEKIGISFSGGKDSIVLNDLVYKMCLSGEIDKSKLIVDFVDEECIFPCIERIVKNTRTKWKLLGVDFRWWCMEFRHMNCLNQLENDESFICWDRFKKDVWVREKPSFAILAHPLFIPRKDKYQDFLPKLLHAENRVSMVGLRVSESIQRLNTIASLKTDVNSNNLTYPIYDWIDSDIWRYIKLNNLDIPNAYLYLYQCGVNKGRLRISHYFSVDTIGNLHKVCEFYNGLFDKICNREPNAYMAMLYYDTELFKRNNKEKIADEKNIDYKIKVFDLIKQKDKFTTDLQNKNLKRMTQLIVLHGSQFTNKVWKEIYMILVGGDPKGRSNRALYTHIFKEVRRENEGN